MGERTSGRRGESRCSPHFSIVTEDKIDGLARLTQAGVRDPWTSGRSARSDARRAPSGRIESPLVGGRARRASVPSGVPPRPGRPTAVTAALGSPSGCSRRRRERAALMSLNDPLPTRSRWHSAPARSPSSPRITPSGVYVGVLYPSRCERVGGWVRPRRMAAAADRPSTTPAGRRSRGSTSTGRCRAYLRAARPRIPWPPTGPTGRSSSRGASLAGQH